MKLDILVNNYFKSILLGSILAITASANAQEQQLKKIDASTTVLLEFSKMKESIPGSLLKITEGIILVPNLLNAGFIVGGKRGRGLAMVKKADGTWSNPVFVTITGGSLGVQIGLQSVDLVLVFKSSESLKNIKKSSFTLGGDISVAAGPIGRNSTANTDYKMEAEVFSYSRSRGLFAGVSINGATLAVDAKSNISFYGRDLSTVELFSAPNSTDAEVRHLKQTLLTMME